ncbi:hypothetical protein ASPWEDRAFT_179674 [Aspergillus wentii DTO 134E9]|uniref:BTB domain-containing protein n=1 Tax=Aspergillus wentii DTO 134E9 TaxID=1073089 RepID=A0A1L9RT22_ASPWE|nr:uncharacterized protein ASPWEDRAFT_179674 [Aspergillus wentii DTO 134E9]KAI9933730.1 hypothetical protein MW887_004802 [Aspergillus wentii]OJJ38070.1 hypothetical protein ASPWEDRAFT_179674 [Aspergillus wentii DTO 134E9]
MAAIPDETITIGTPSDLTVKIIEYEVKREFRTDPETNEDRVITERTPKKSALIQVSRAKLIQNSEYFRRMLSSRWSGSDNTISLEEDTIKSMEVWFRLFHGNLSAMPCGSVSVPEMWHIIMAADKYEFDRTRLESWFDDWFFTQQNKAMTKLSLNQQLLFPCHYFNCAWGFKILTKELVYKYPHHITEINPTSHHQMHLPHRVIQQLNAAKGRLRTILQRGLFSQVSSIVNYAICDCKEKTVFNYLKEIQNINVRPLDETLSRTSVQRNLDRLGQFNESNMRPKKDSNVIYKSVEEEWGEKPSAKDCMDCDRSWGEVVRRARKETAEYFDGLCLDCMNTTKNIRLRGDEDDDYWLHNEGRDRYDDGCRISHGQPTWYFSFMGRREKRGQFV